MFVVENKGQVITATNYWNSQHASKGLCFLSWNAGAARLLVPDSMKQFVREMRSAKYVIVSRGPWLDYSGRDALELLFEDGSDSPFCIHMQAEQTDRLLPGYDRGGRFVFSVWTSGGHKLTLPGRYRRVAEIPCLDAW